jgi:hypothetical protein
MRYRYYVSHGILQKRKAQAASIARVPAPDIEKLVLDGVRKHLASMGETEHPTAIPADLTVTGLAQALPYSWAEQEQRIGLRQNRVAE